jgi:transcription elongation factor Elf1
MGRSDLTELTLACPACGAANSLVANKVSSTAKVLCSHCHAELGTWGDLTARALDHSLPKAS